MSRLAVALLDLRPFLVTPSFSLVEEAQGFRANVSFKEKVFLH